MIYRFFYSMLVVLGILFLLPKLLWQYFVHGKYRKSLAERFGIGIPYPKRGEGPVLWVHAVSMGETRAIAPLASQFKEKHPDATVICTSVTETGLAEAKRAMPFASSYFHLPIDIQWIIRPIVKRISPDLLLLSEGDYWYQFLEASKESGAKIAVVNGKLSEKSLKRLKWFSGFSHRIFSLVDYFYLQGEVYRKRFLQLHIPKEKLIVTGNLKLDQEQEPVGGEGFCEILGIPENAPVITLGSSHAPEEHMLMDMLSTLWGDFPELRVLVVPRHPERFDDVAKLLGSFGMKVARFSEQKADPSAQVILIDAMGQLRRCYAISDIAIVGGSFFPGVGGHNILEPCPYAVPVLYGTYMHSQPDLEEVLHASGAGEQITPSEIPNALRNLLATPSLRNKMGEAGVKLTQELKGATEKTFRDIEEKRLLENHV